MAACKQCKFFEHNIMVCRRFPPQVIVDQVKTDKGIITDWVSETKKIVVAFPRVASDDWCGEFYQKNNIAPA